MIHGAKTACISFSKNEMYMLSVAYAVSAVNTVDSEVRLYVIDEYNISEQLNNLVNYNPKFIIIHVSYHCYGQLKYSSKNIKKSLPESIIIACNNVASCLAEDILRDISEIDFVVRGEFEKIVENITSTCTSLDDVKRIDGVSFVEQDIYYANPITHSIPIDSLKNPDREYCENRTRNFMILGSRGCEGRCVFCDKNYLFSLKSNNNHCLRSIDSIVDEIDYLVKKYNCKFVNFIDSSFCDSINTVQRLNEFYEKMKLKDYWVQFLFSLRAEQINAEVVCALLKLKEIGLSKVYIGIESFVESDLNLFRKRSNPQTNKEAICWLKRLNSDTPGYIVEIGYGFIFFNPFTTKEQLKENYSALCSNCMFINPYILTTKMSVNLLGDMLPELDNRGLLPKRLSQLSLEEKMQRRIAYNFESQETQRIYDLLLKCRGIIEYKNFNGIEALRNRYYHFWGYDSSLKEFDNKYMEWKQTIDMDMRVLLNTILYSTEDWASIHDYAINHCIMSKERIGKAQSMVERSKLSLALKLHKIDELVYQ